jgi:hypothetical protein
LNLYLQETVWGIQSGIPVVFQALEVDLPAGRAHSEAWHRFPPVKPVEVAPNHWRWEIKDMPALDLRGCAPVRNGRLSPRACPSSGAMPPSKARTISGAPSASGSPPWRPIAPTRRRRLPPRPQSLIAGAPDFYAKLSRITEYIQKNVRYFIVERGIGGLQANHAADIYRNRYGDCKDKTTLLISMLQVAGIHAFYMPVDDRRDIVDPDAPSLDGNHMITAIEIPADVQDPRLKAIVKANDGKRYLIFDPTNRAHPRRQSALLRAGQLRNPGRRPGQPDHRASRAGPGGQRHTRAQRLLHAFSRRHADRLRRHLSIRVGRR